MNTFNVLRQSLSLKVTANIYLTIFKTFFHKDTYETYQGFFLSYCHVLILLLNNHLDCVNVVRYMRVIPSVFAKNILCCFSAVINGIAAYSSELTADDGAEGFCRVSHESFNLLHGARDAGQQLYTISCHCDVIFNANLHTAAIHVSQTRQNHQLSQCKNVKADMNSCVKYEPDGNLRSHGRSLLLNIFLEELLVSQSFIQSFAKHERIAMLLFCGPSKCFPASSGELISVLLGVAALILWTT